MVLVNCFTYRFANSVFEETQTVLPLPVVSPTGPCAPAHTDTFVQCEDHVGSVSWSPSDGAQRYIAVATDSNGVSHQCETNNTMCTWNNLQCGKHYSVQVMAADASCTSLPSNSSTIHMGEGKMKSSLPYFSRIQHTVFPCTVFDCL